MPMKISTVEELNRFSISIHDFEDSQKFLSESLKHEYGSTAKTKKMNNGSRSYLQ